MVDFNDSDPDVTNINEDGEKATQGGIEIQPLQKDDQQNDLAEDEKPKPLDAEEIEIA